MNEPQETFDELLARYNGGFEPLENWTTVDLVKLIDAADKELQNRAPPDSTYGYEQTNPPQSDDDY